MKEHELIAKIEETISPITKSFELKSVNRKFSEPRNYDANILVLVPEAKKTLEILNSLETYLENQDFREFAIEETNIDYKDNTRNEIITISAKLYL